MNNKLCNIFLITLVVVLILSGCHPHRSRHSSHDKDRSIQHISSQLDLSPDQEIKVAPILAELSALKKQGERLKKDWYDQIIFDLKSGFKTDVASEKFREEKVKKYSELVERFSVESAKLIEIMSTEQRQALVSLLEKHQVRHHRGEHYN